MIEEVKVLWNDIFAKNLKNKKGTAIKIQKGAF